MRAVLLRSLAQHVPPPPASLGIHPPGDPPHACPVPAVRALDLVALPSPARAQTPAYQFAWGTSGSGLRQFQDAHGIATAPDGSVYVADTFNSRIQEFTSAGASVRTWATTFPGAVAVGPLGDVYVAGNDVIAHFTATGVPLAPWGSSGSGDGQFDLPLDLAVDAGGNVYVTDWMNHRVQKFTSGGVYLTQWGTSGTGPGQFVQPAGIAVDAAGTVYVTDMGTHTVQAFDSAGQWIRTWGGLGTGPGQFDFPTGVTADADGFGLVTDSGNQRVQVFRRDGSWVLSFGSAGSGAGQFNHPTAIDVGPTGGVYVLDKDNGRVEVFDAVATPVRAPSWGALKARWR
jgi:DNA-binding beta-propeller fold protein YncE